MFLPCSVCGESYRMTGTHNRDRLDMCMPCFDKNFSGASPPLDVHTPMAREALDAYVEAPVETGHQLTPRQVQALARMHVYWQRRQAGEGEA